MMVIILSLALILVQLPVLFHGGPAGLATALLPMIFTLSAAALAQSQRRFSSVRDIGDRSFVANALLFIGLMTVCFVRGVTTGTVPAIEALQQIAVLWTVFVFGVVATRTGIAAKEGVSYILAAVTLYLLFNVALRAAGWSSTVNDDVAADMVARMLFSLGILSERVLFPTASGVNSFGIAGGIAVAGGIAGLRDGGGVARKTLFAASALIGAYVALRTDSRIALASAMLAGAAALLLPMHRLRAVRLSVVFIPVLPIAIAGIAIAVAQWIDATALVRNPEELLSAGQRIFVWTAVAQELQSFRLEHLWGFGFFGQTASMVVQRFGDVVGDGYDTSRLSAHNMLLQNILDIGYIGATSVLFLLWQSIDRVEHLPTLQRRPFIAIIVFFLLSGGTEASPTAYFRESYVVLLLLVGYTVSRAGSAPVKTDRTAAPTPRHPPEVPAL
jgi:hypothetical protein